MARAKPRFSLSIKDTWTGKSWTIGLIQAEVIGRFWPMYNSRKSKKTASDYYNYAG